MCCILFQESVTFLVMNGLDEFWFDENDNLLRLRRNDLTDAGLSQFFVSYIVGIVKVVILLNFSGLQGVLAVLKFAESTIPSGTRQYECVQSALCTY